MPIEAPKIDDRSYQDILNEALARIRVHNPEWNNFNDSDPGITLLQLFAFIGEDVLYRTNLIPERNRAKFLDLLGIPMQPAAAASGLVTFTNTRVPAQTLTLPRDLDVNAGKVPFRTLDGLDVLPVEATVYYKHKRSDESIDESLQAYWELVNNELGESGKPVFYETMPLSPPLDPANLPLLDLGGESVLDGSAWVALLAPKPEALEETRAVIANKVLNLGFYPAVDEQPAMVLGGDRDSSQRDLVLTFELSSEQETAPGIPRYQPLNPLSSDDVLTRPGVVSLRLPEEAALRTWVHSEPLLAGRGDYPPSLTETRDEGRLICWLRVRLADRSRAAGLSARFHWLGINAARVSQRARVAAETLGQATGEPDASFNLRHTPVIEDSVRITVDGQPWQRIDDLYQAGPEVPVADPREPSTSRAGPEIPREVFTLDRESGLIRFGDGLHGARPPNGARLRAEYDYGGGARGNVNIDAINKGSSLPAGTRVSNPLPTWGGAEGETVAEAERNIPRYLQHQDRLVAADDFKDLARRTPGVNVGRTEVLPLYDPVLDESLSPGMVTLMVIPAEDPVHPEHPRPDQRMLQLVCQHLEPRRLITTELHVQGPRYVSLILSVGIEMVDGRDFPPVREAVKAALRRFLSPTKGGREQQGWPLHKHVVAMELWAEAARVDGVAYVNSLLLGDLQGNGLEELPLSGLQLPLLWKIEIREGEPATLESLLGERAGEGGTNTGGSGVDKPPAVVPIPIVPPEC